MGTGQHIHDEQYSKDDLDSLHMELLLSMRPLIEFEEA
jgi:hypothetical protein